MGVILTSTQIHRLSTKYPTQHICNQNVQLKRGTTVEDFLDANYVALCSENGVCTRSKLQKFIISERKEMVDDSCTLPQYSSREMSTFVSPTVQRYQEAIQKAANNTTVDTCDRVINVDDSNQELDFDMEADGMELNEDKDEQLDELYGKISRADLRKSCIESIDGILNSHKFPDSYALRLRDRVTELVSSLHEERNKELDNNSQTGHSREYEFPCLENRRGPAEKRKKNSLG